MIKHIRSHTQIVEMPRPFGPVELKYETYSGDSKQEALDFLEKQSVEDPYNYVVVETPEGCWGRDIAGIYDEADGILALGEPIADSNGARTHDTSIDWATAIAVWNNSNEGDRYPVKIYVKDTGRNDPCPCGSGKKYKHCCMN